MKMKVKVGVMGSAGGRISQEQKQKLYRLGQEIARQDCILITGGCPGLPHEATRGADEAGGLTIGISPGLSLHEHITRYQSPTDHIDLLIYTGSGLMGREITAVRSCDVVIVAGGRSGTLGEFAIAYDEGKPIGVYMGTGGITERLQDIVGSISKESGSEIIYSEEPKELLEKLLEIHERVKDRPPRYAAAD